ncbi:21426_t:CDS:2 [Gigaspora margarita]|uniref:21426_t:CDS:1 n=1 Tax=Gigaspora margarita TaxID=4874 RepID=A0ABM8W6Y8_GIGMA|nr:21426_t:CDS:2 [Gigaspora margarita]
MESKFYRIVIANAFLLIGNILYPSIEKYDLPHLKCISNSRTIKETMATVHAIIVMIVKIYGLEHTDKFTSHDEITPPTKP